jgi:hypothetical protein
VWFANTTNFSGPVHTNDEFRFLQFPTFTDRLESVNTNAWFYNGGSQVELANNENVNNGTRIDAPLVPPNSNPQAAAAANFTRGHYQPDRRRGARAEGGLLDPERHLRPGHRLQQQLRVRLQ